MKLPDNFTEYFEPIEPHQKGTGGTSFIVDGQWYCFKYGVDTMQMFLSTLRSKGEQSGSELFEELWEENGGGECGKDACKNYFLLAWTYTEQEEA